MSNLNSLYTRDKEPFGYFRAQWFGWEDCAKHHEGAIAMYTLSDLDGVSLTISEMKLITVLRATIKTERDTLAANLAAEQAAPTAQDKTDIVDELIDLLGCQWSEVYHQVALLAYKAKEKQNETIRYNTKT